MVRHLAAHLVLVAVVAGALTLVGAPLAVALPIAMVAGCLWMLVAMSRHGADQRQSPTEVAGASEAARSEPEREGR